jgi:predicted Rossmann fold nucleotide-binding protein DprA/Smf involved in DNA uptake
LVESAGDIVESLGLLTAESASDDAVGPGAVAAKSAPAPVSVRPSGRSSGSSASASPPGVSPAAATESEPQELLFSAPQEKILAAIGNGADSGLDELCQQTSLPASVVMAELTMLELRGVIRRTPRQTFEKT